MVQTKEWGESQNSSFPVDTSVILMQAIRKYYMLGKNTVPALYQVDLEVKQGEFVAIMGPSGSGKSTLMNIIGCLDRPSDGTYLLGGVKVSEMNTGQLAAVRNQLLGFVFQSFNLLSWMTAQENVELPLVYGGVPRQERRQLASRALALVGLSARANHRPAELSGGQQQRVAIARVLVTDPALILADEPTGNLDSRVSLDIMAILQELNARGSTIILVTHENDIARYCKRRVALRDGRVVRDELAQAEDARTQRNEHLATEQKKETAGEKSDEQA